MNKAMTFGKLTLAFALGPLSALPASTAADAPAPRVDADLIPREQLFGNPSRTGAKISPDGTQIAFLAPLHGVLNVWVAPAEAIDDAKPLTDEKVRPIRVFFWSPDSLQILYLQDKGGTEDFLLYGVPLGQGSTRNYTPFENTRVEIVAISPAVPDAILIGVNQRDPRWHDVYRLNLTSGELTLVRENDGYSGFEADYDLQLRLATKSLPGGGSVIERIESDGSTVPIAEIGPEDALTSNLIGIPKGADFAYAIDTRGRDKAALMQFDLRTGQTTLIAESDQADIGGVLRDPVTGRVQAYNIDYLTERWIPVGDDLKEEIAFLDREAKGQWSVSSRDQADHKWTIAVDRVTEPAAYYLFHREERRLEKLFTVRPELEDDPLVAMHPREIPSRDGQTLVSYLSLPPGTDPDGDGVPAQPLPMVLLVHGGPWARDSFGFDSEHQWLANRGYAVLSVNFRGSTGFGKSFTNLGDQQWGRTMHNDLLDAVNWAVAKGIALQDRIAIYGGSYGGYATLWAVTQTPEVFACGVDIVGPSNLETLLASVPPYWASFFEQLARRVGDPRTDEGRALLKERSPLTYVDQIEKPLLIAQGANDPRVKQAESDQIVEAMKQKDIPVTYVLYPDEGHGFAVPQNRLSFYAIAEAFLAKCLGGRYEPVGEAFSGASLKVPEGAEPVPGLQEALHSKR